MQSCIMGDTISSRLGGRPPSKKNPIWGEGLHPQRPQPYSTTPLGPISLTRKGRTLCRSFVGSRSELLRSFPVVFWHCFVQHPFK